MFNTLAQYLHRNSIERKKSGLHDSAWRDNVKAQGDDESQIFHKNSYIVSLICSAVELQSLTLYYRRSAYLEPNNLVDSSYCK
jgi:hypothetical protein